MQVIQESKHQLRTAERYLHALRMAYPEVMASIRTKQVAQEMLLVKEAYVHELKASGNYVPQQIFVCTCCLSCSQLCCLSVLV